MRPAPVPRARAPWPGGRLGRSTAWRLGPAGRDDLVEGLRNLAGDAVAVGRHADGEVADPHGLQGMQEFVQLTRGFAVGVGGYLGSVLARSCHDRRGSSLLAL